MNRIWAGTKPHVVYGPYKYLWHAQRSRFSLPTASEAPVPHPRFIHSPRALAKTQWSAASKGFQKSMMLIRPPRFLSPSPAAAPGEPRLRRPLDASRIFSSPRPPGRLPGPRPASASTDLRRLTARIVDLTRRRQLAQVRLACHIHPRTPTDVDACFVFFFLAGGDTGMARRSWRR
jgi:hypothetical protein